MRAIFISYRRDDTEGHAGRLFEDLCDRFGKDSVFMDVTGIEPGRDFRRVIEQQVASCGVLLAVIGKTWLNATDAKGHRRLDDPYDFVRLETASALKRDIPVIPVLVHHADMPRAEQLPDDLKDLAFRNSVELTHPRWSSDVQLLITALLPYVDASPPTPPLPTPTPPPPPPPPAFQPQPPSRHSAWTIGPLAVLAAGGIGYVAWDRLAPAADAPRSVSTAADQTAASAAPATDRASASPPDRSTAATSTTDATKAGPTADRRAAASAADRTAALPQSDPTASNALPTPAAAAPSVVVAASTPAPAVAAADLPRPGVDKPAAPAPAASRRVDKPAIGRPPPASSDAATRMAAAAIRPLPAAPPPPAPATPPAAPPPPAPATPPAAPAVAAPTPAPAVAAAAIPAAPMSGPPSREILAGRKDPGLWLFGSPGSPSMVVRSIAIRPETTFVNVTGGEVIRFDVGDRSFVWNFDGPRTTFDLALVAPPSLLDRKVTAYVAPNPLYRRRN